MLNEFPFSIRFILCALTIWRLCHLVTAEDGPWDVVVRIRAALGNSMPGHAMDCFYCATLWLAMPFCFLVAERIWARIVCWLALSGAAALMEQTSASLQARAQPPPRGDGDKRP